MFDNFFEDFGFDLSCDTAFELPAEHSDPFVELSNELFPDELATGELDFDHAPRAAVDFGDNFESFHPATSDPEMTSTLDEAAGGWPFESILGEAGVPLGDVSWDPATYDGPGDPLGDIEYWHQQEGDNSCAVVAQMGAVESLLGHPIGYSEDSLCDMAKQAGIFDPESGTALCNVGKVAEAFGCEVNQFLDANLDDISVALERGEKVIVGLDANEIWSPRIDAATGERVEQVNAGHAVMITGLQTCEDGSRLVILNDSGVPDGAMKAVRQDDFLNAWRDYGNQYTTIRAPREEYAA